MPQLFFNEVELGSADVLTTEMLPEPADCTSSPNPQGNPNIQEQGISDSPTEKHFGKMRKNADDTCSSISGYRRARTAFSSAQLYHLEQEFLMDPYISRSKRKTLAEFLQLPEITIKVWFQNRRMKDKRARLNSQWQYTHSQPLNTVYGNTVVRSPPLYATYPVPTYAAPSPSPYPPMPFYGYPDIPALAHPASCGYSLCTSPQEALDIPRYTYGTSVSPVESGTVPISLSTTYGSSTPLSAYYHSYPICNTCTGLEPLNLDVKSLKTEDKKVEDTKTNTLFRPFDE